MPGLSLIALDHLIEQHQRYGRGTWGNLGEGALNFIHWWAANRATTGRREPV